MTRRSTVRLITAVFAVAVGGLVAIMIGTPDAAVLVAPFAVLLALGLSGARRQDVLGAVVAEPARVMAGDEVTVSSRISGARGWIRVTAKQDDEFVDRASTLVPEGWDPSDDAATVVDVATDAHPVEVQSTLTTSAWGTYDLGMVDLEVNEPYGLLQWSGTLHTPNPVRVHPAPSELDELLAPWLVRRLAGAHDSPAAGQGVEFADIRPFTAGDSLRDINWRASARSEELLVSQRHPDQSTDVVLFLDTFVESGHEIRTVLGLAVEAAIALAESHLSVTDRVGLVELGGIVRWVSPRTGRLQMQRLVDALLATRLYENSAERDLSIIPPRALPPRSFIVALSPLLDERFIQALFVLRAAGHDVSVVECPPVVSERPLPPTKRTGFRIPGRARTVEPSQRRIDAARIARKLWQADRDLVRDQLASQGVSVGRWQPGEHIDQPISELIRRRRGALATVRR